MADYTLVDAPDGIKEEEETSGFDFRTIINIIILNWYWIALSMLICFACAKIYLRYTPPVYSAGMRVLIKDARSNQRGGSNINTNALEEVGVISTSNGFDNELEILQSTAIAKRVVKALKLYTSYVLERRVKDSELYKNSAIIVDLDEESIENLNTPISMTITCKGKGYHVDGSVAGKHFSKDIEQLPATISTAVGTLSLQKNPGFEQPRDKALYVTIRPLIDAARAYVGKLSTAETGRATTTARLQFFDTQMSRALDYLNQLMISYNEDANEDKNEVARKTEKFIGERIEVIRKELDSTEINIETFKKSHNLINLANDATNALANRNSYDKEQVTMQTQLTLVRSLIDYVSNPENAREVIPANLGLSGNQATALIEEYNKLVTQRKRLLKASSEENPTVIRLTEQLDDLWPIIGTMLKSSYEDMLIRKGSIDNQYGRYAGRISEVPTQERALNNIGRQQEIKAGLYLMLLQKREQNFISLASTATKARIIDDAKPLGQVSPDNKKIQTIALGIGFLTPIIILLLLQFLSYRIEGREDVLKLTTIPIIADIPLAAVEQDNTSGVVVSENKNNMMEEAFRGLRTNLRFVLTNTEKVVCCTSCIPGEGKSFVAANLAMSLSLLGKQMLTTLTIGSTSHIANVEMQNCNAYTVSRVMSILAAVAASQLSSVRLAFGSQASPSVLSDTDIQTLLALDGSPIETKQFSGYITKSSGSISGSTWAALNAMNITYVGVVTPEVNITALDGSPIENNAASVLSGDGTHQFTASVYPTSAGTPRFRLYNGDTLVAEDAQGKAAYNGATLDCATGALTTTAVETAFAVKVSAYVGSGASEVESAKVAVTVERTVLMGGFTLTGTKSYTATGDNTLVLTPTDSNYTVAVTSVVAELTYGGSDASGDSYLRVTLDSIENLQLKASVLSIPSATRQYSLHVTATDAKGNTYEQTETLTVQSIPVTSFSLSGDAEVTSTGSHTYSVASILPANYNRGIASLAASVSTPTSGTIAASVPTGSTSAVTLTVTEMPESTETVRLTVIATLEGGGNVTAEKDISLKVSSGGAEGFVDLGLPSGLLWADRNIGASEPEAFGLYFQWGDTEGHTEGSGYDFSSANYNSKGLNSISADLALSQDAANAALGGSCRMPTKTEFQELYDNTDTEWTTVNSVAGRKFMKKSDHSVFIFFPAAGCYNGTSLGVRGSVGYYWSGSFGNSSYAYRLGFNSGGVDPQNGYDRYYGVPVRAVQ
mgnify:CR=1 FL=1